ncbi:MAG: hypothetical protein A2252_11900 [Elusimicrobia bacterium RIFOXYA2_FULL_39_19]|nr:MAG: hypothetical protein A2252_11900 [Elusimicrobia bacterium RIFOXYA2_FULL_39_19]
MKNIDKTKKITFQNLVNSICGVHKQLLNRTIKAVNAGLTIRNWVIGYYIEEYERAGTDRARYGDRLMDELSDTLIKQGIDRCDRRELYRYRQFYLSYPQIVDTVSPQYTIQGKFLIENLSFSHLAQLIEIDDPLKKMFYEHMCIQGNF